MPLSDYLKGAFPELCEKTHPFIVYGEIISLAKRTLKDSEDFGHPSAVENSQLIIKALEVVAIGTNTAVLGSAIENAYLTSILAVSETIDRDSPEYEIDIDELKKIRSSILDLIDEVCNSDIGESLKQFILDKLDSIEKAINLYPIHGDKNLFVSAQETIGGIRLEIVQKKAEATSPLLKNLAVIATSVLAVIGAVNTTVDFIENVDQLAEKFLENKTIDVEVKALPTSSVDEGNPQDAEAPVETEVN